MHGMSPHEEIDYWRERAKVAEAERDRLRAALEEALDAAIDALTAKGSRDE